MTTSRRGAHMPDEQVIAFLEDVLVAQGYMLPREARHITSEDLALYGKGTSRSVSVLRQSFESLMEDEIFAEGPTRDISEALAMAARNGTGISDDVWTRMRADRGKAEAESGRDE